MPSKYCKWPWLAQMLVARSPRSALKTPDILLIPLEAPQGWISNVQMFPDTDASIFGCRLRWWCMMRSITSATASEALCGRRASCSRRPLCASPSCPPQSPTPSNLHSGSPRLTGDRHPGLLQFPPAQSHQRLQCQNHAVVCVLLAQHHTIQPCRPA